ncbi:hypothetical protein [Candidatus Chromulinivorax destructor]|uniref:Uncharacterized protein n=1 Tax=Candidatus Chromulinivorax destructor TaxID=2066483 RepID=A0A345ZBR7_9BACT|nr:hypothetical protein [Candidatus Chromulinivorax destructor]AXK60734.1 hypothetical protein C0J27_03185 [Candidatus Chromulinivorax destructor]
MKNLNLYLTMTLMAIVPASPLLSSGANTASIASAETAVIQSNSIAGSQTMGLASEFSSSVTPAPAVTSIDSGNVATPSAPTPVESATLLSDNSAPVQVMPVEQPAQNVAVALAPVEPTVPAPVVTEADQAQVAPVSQQAAQESVASAVPATNQETTTPSEEECAWNSMGSCVQSALFSMYAAACNGVTAVKNMIW